MNIVRRSAAWIFAAASLASVPVKAETWAIPFEYTSRHAPLILVEGRIGQNRKKASVVVDTGATPPFAVFLSRAMASDLALAQSEEAFLPGSAAPGARPQPYRTAQLDRFELGPVELESTEVAVMPMLDEMGPGVGHRVDVIIGQHFFRDRVFSIDYAARRINLAATAEPDVEPITFTLPTKRPLILVRAMVNDAGPFVMEIDTGASATVLSPAAAERAGAAIQGQGLNSGPGGKSAVGIAKAKVIFAGVERVLAPIAVSSMITSISTGAGADIDGILGTDFFQGTRLTIDFPNRKLWLVPRP